MSGFVDCRGTLSDGAVRRQVRCSKWALINWEDAMSVGVDVLDADHIIVASLINHIDDAKQSGTDERAIGRILRVLIDHPVRHFAHKDGLLKAHDYPRLDEHNQRRKRSYLPPSVSEKSSKL